MTIVSPSNSNSHSLFDVRDYVLTASIKIKNKWHHGSIHREYFVSDEIPFCMSRKHQPTLTKQEGTSTSLYRRVVALGRKGRKGRTPQL